MSKKIKTIAMTTALTVAMSTAPVTANACLLPKLNPEPIVSIIKSLLPPCKPIFPIFPPCPGKPDNPSTPDDPSTPEDSEDAIWVNASIAYSDKVATARFACVDGYFVVPEYNGTVPEDYEFSGYYSYTTEKYYAAGDMIPLEEMENVEGEYYITLSAQYNRVKPEDVTYIDEAVYNVNIQYALYEADLEDPLFLTSGQFESLDDISITVPRARAFSRGPLKDLDLYGYKSAVTDTMFRYEHVDGTNYTFTAANLPEAEIVDVVEGEVNENNECVRTTYYEINDVVVPYFTAYGKTAPYENFEIKCKAVYYRRADFMNPDSGLTPVFGDEEPETVTILLEDEAKGFALKTPKADDNPGYIFIGYSIADDENHTLYTDSIPVSAFTYQNGPADLTFTLIANYEVDPDYVWEEEEDPVEETPAPPMDDIEEIEE